MHHAPCSSFILADPTDIPRPQAKKTEMDREFSYDGLISDLVEGEDKGRCGREMGFKEAIWIITSLRPEGNFRDLKRLLNLEKIMSKNMEKVIALVLMAYVIGLLVGEALRDRMYGGDHTDHKGDLDNRPKKRFGDHPRWKGDNHGSSYLPKIRAGTLNVPTFITQGLPLRGWLRSTSRLQIFGYLANAENPLTKWNSGKKVLWGDQR